MALPKIRQPLHTFTIPSTGKEVQFRPFLVSEEKILLMGQASGSSKEIVKSIQQVINNCAVSDNINIEDLTTFDVEYIFIKLRGVSVNNIIKVKATDPDDGEQYDVEINTDDIEIHHTEDHSDKIKVNDEITLKMRYPAIDMMDALEKSGTEIEVFFELMTYSIDK